MGISGTALDWFSSYLLKKKSCVSINYFVSSFFPTKYGVPQGSILGPVPFSFYMLPLGDVISRLNISFHCYADNTHILALV